ncbi:MAG: hypothetical protein Q8O37_05490 [Sulfuricellaceae bacterium]|nr:hypothetical protein [Sulfuricellaceae bacterium]
MNTVAIPAWNAQGIIPPINELQPTAAERSPYTVSLTDFVLRFGQSPERRVVLDGFLRYRAALHAVGLSQGFQWLDGSFLEHVELLETRAPNDIDVVTFFELPAGKTQLDVQQLAPALFPTTRDAHQAMKDTYRVDAYLEHLGKAPVRLAKQSSYWYSMWSHRRNQIWKGYVQINLAPTDDALAIAALTNPVSQGMQP